MRRSSRRAPLVGLLGFAARVYPGVALGVRAEPGERRHHVGRRGGWVPDLYPMFCLSYNLVLAACVASLATRGGVA